MNQYQALARAASYPVIPANHMNREMRRAARHGKVVQAIRALPSNLFLSMWANVRPLPGVITVDTAGNASLS